MPEHSHNIDMARIWTEPYQQQAGPPYEYWTSIDDRAYHFPNPEERLNGERRLVTFRFFGIQQIRDCIDVTHGRRIQAAGSTSGPLNTGKCNAGSSGFQCTFWKNRNE